MYQPNNNTSKIAMVYKYLFMTLLLLAFSSSVLTLPTSQSGLADNTAAVLAQTVPTSHTIYLPATVNRYPLQTAFGVEMSSVTAARGLDGVVEADTTWVRRNGLLWKDVEPIEGKGYNWTTPSVKALEQEMLNARANDLKMILIVRGSPRWATTDPADCAPIKPEKYAAFARFMRAAVERYSKPPYSVEFWELGNEPDGPYRQDNVWGCWGDAKDPYYGGRAYGNMLKVVYPAIKAANSNVKVLNGGLLLAAPHNPKTGEGLAARFLEGIFVAGAGSSFDVVSYHSYSHYNGNPDGSSGPTDWKVGYLRNLMRSYEAPQKPLFNTEGALLCWNKNTSECRQPQAEFIPRLYARAMRDGLMGQIWYAYDGDSFRSTGLVEPNDVAKKRPAYHSYKYAASMIGGTDYLGPLQQQPSGVEGYRFRRGSETVILFWSNTARSTTIQVPTGATVRCTNRDGGVIACANISGSVKIDALPSPRYIVIR